MLAQALAAQDGVTCLHVTGLSLLQLRNYDDGFRLLKTAVAFRPTTAQIYIDVCLMAERLGRADDLEYFVTRGLRDFPSDVSLLRHQANLFLIRQDYPQAIAAYERLLTGNPDDIRSWINLGNTYRVLTQFSKADDAYARAAKLDPDDISLCVNRSGLFTEQGRLTEAIAYLEQGIDDADAKFMLSLLLLGTGDYERGFDLHRDRWHSSLFLNTVIPPRPFERLSDVSDKQICVLREGGFGDVFQFMRYLPLIAEMAQEVLFHPLPSEFRLLRENLPENITLEVAPDTNSINVSDDFAYTTALLDLPYWFGTRLDNIPADIPYIHVPQTIIQRHRLPFTAKKRIGLVWAGAPQTGINMRSYDQQRSIKLEDLNCLAEFSDRVTFYSLQFDDSKRVNFETFNVIKTIESDFDWMDTAAIVAQMDLVISVDTAVLHLAAAMGITTWVLSRFNPCWRWHRNQKTSPWYPNVVKVYGQTQFGDWSEPISNLKHDMEIWLG